MIALQPELVHSGGAKLKTAGEEGWGMQVVKRGRKDMEERDTELQGKQEGEREREMKGSDDRERGGERRGGR